MSEEEINKGLKILVKSSIIVFVGILFSKILTYIYRIIIARFYGPEVYGLFSIAVMILGFFVAFFSLGFSDGLVRFIPWYSGKKQSKKIKYLFRISSVITIFSGILAAVILFFLAEKISRGIFHNTDLIIFLKIFSLLIPVYMIANIYLSVLQSFEKVTWNSFLLNILQNGVKVIAILLLIFLGFKKNAVIISFFLGIFLMFVFSYFVCKKITKEVFGNSLLNDIEKQKIRKEFVSYSWPLLFAGIISSLLFWIDSFSIGYFKTAVEVGLYNAAVPLVLLIRFAPEIFLKLFFPFITKEFSRGNKIVVTELSKQVSKWIFVANLPVFMLLVLFPESVINLFFGEDYLSVANSVRILAFGMFAISSTFISNNLLYIVGKTRLILWDLILVSIINLILNTLLVPKYGIGGAAIATTISNIILATLFFFQSRKHAEVFPIRRKMFGILLVSIIPFLTMIFLKTKIQETIPNFFLLAIFFVLTYTLLIFLTNCLDKNDFMILKGLKGKVWKRGISRA